MGLGDMANKAKEFIGKQENKDKVNEKVDNLQEQHGDKLGKHSDKVSEFVDNQQEQRLGAGGEDQGGQAGEGGEGGQGSQGGTPEGQGNGDAHGGQGAQGSQDDQGGSDQGQARGDGQRQG